MVDVRRLAAIDMYGGAGTLRRRRIILAEFVLGAAGGIALGIVVLATGTAIFGLFLIGIGANYLPLAMHAIRLSRPGVLERELEGVDVPAELRRYTILQFWVFVPGLFAALELAQTRG